MEQHELRVTYNQVAPLEGSTHRIKCRSRIVDNHEIRSMIAFPERQHEIFISAREIITGVVIQQGVVPLNDLPGLSNELIQWPVQGQKFFVRCFSNEGMVILDEPPAPTDISLKGVQETDGEERGYEGRLDRREEGFLAGPLHGDTDDE